jgi:hypothetical protein
MCCLQKFQGINQYIKAIRRMGLENCLFILQIPRAREVLEPVPLVPSLKNLKHTFRFY